MLVEVKAGGTLLSSGNRRPRRDERDRRGPPQQGEPPDGPHVLRRYPDGAWPPGRQELQARELSAPDGSTVIEARLVEMRRAHPRWGPRSIRAPLAQEGFTPVPGRSSIYRTLVRHRLLEPTPRKRARSDYKRWERSRSMELWQMDVVGRFHLARRHRRQGRHWRRRPLCKRSSAPRREVLARAIAIARQ